VRKAVGFLHFPMKFRSNNCVAVHLPDLRKAEAFYTGVMGFRLLAKSATQLEYDTGRFLLHVNKGSKLRSPIPSFTVISTQAAKAHLEQNGCEIIDDRGGSLYFKDPFGMIYDVIED
jgi:catechol 2,3-dioxygenase-like lactoylglutathione lyase family enzyme